MMLQERVGGHPMGFVGVCGSMFGLSEGLRCKRSQQPHFVRPDLTHFQHECQHD